MYIEKYTGILMFALLAEDDKYKFAKAAEIKNYLSVLFEENRTETWIYNWTAWNKNVKVISAIETNNRIRNNYKYNPKYK